MGGLTWDALPFYIHRFPISSSMSRQASFPVLFPLTACRSAMFHREGVYASPDRLRVGVRRETGKPIFCEGFGEWRSAYALCDDSNDLGLDTIGFELKFQAMKHYWWEWNFEEVVAAEAEISRNKEEAHDEALRVELEDAEQWRRLNDDIVASDGHRLNRSTHGGRCPAVHKGSITDRSRSPIRPRVLGRAIPSGQNAWRAARGQPCLPTPSAAT